jgi:regulator of cell morphogenesis and NO signaling
MNNLSKQTLASLVISNPQIVPVLEKYNLDFCCKGKRMLDEACLANGLDVNAVVKDLEAVSEKGGKDPIPFTEMSAGDLIDHIVSHHHDFVKQSMPVIMGLLSKVASKHGERFPYMTEVLELFAGIREEMTNHMKKEEFILFPLIKEQEAQKLTGSAGIYDVNISGPVNQMLAEHETAGDIMFRIRKLTGNYNAPENACTTFKVSLIELKEFEDDLHKHVHLENNILFVKAQAMVA